MQEMAALGRALVMQKLRERALGPTLRRGVDFVGIRAYADGNRDAFGVKETRLRRLQVFPVTLAVTWDIDPKVKPRRNGAQGRN